jgi:hypothetical protein
MPRYFNKFPKLIYTRQGVPNVVTNLLARVDIIRTVLDNVSLYYEYDIQEGDTPEIIASKYYNDAELHWVVLMFNNLFDSNYDWPLTYGQFQSFIQSKYGSIENAKLTKHHYEKIVTKFDSQSSTTTVDTFILPLSIPYIDRGQVDDFDALPTTNLKVGDGYVTDDTSDLYVWNGENWSLETSFKAYNLIVPSSQNISLGNGNTLTYTISKRMVDSYDFEDELNESKRRIKLVKAELIPEIKKQFEILMSV